jgi:hypothetical protein
MSIYALEDLLLRYIGLISTSSSNACCLSTYMSALDSAAMEYSFVYWRVSLRDNVQRGRIERSHPKNIIQSDRNGGGSTTIWGEINHDGKTSRVTMNGTPHSQTFNRGFWKCAVSEPGSSYYILIRKRSAAHRKRNPNTFYGRISMHWVEYSPTSALDGLRLSLNMISQLSSSCWQNVNSAILCRGVISAVLI